MMSPSYNHSYAQARLIGALLQTRKCTVLSELTLDIDGRDYIPDVCAYPPQPVDWLHDTIKVSKMPVLAIEILSPTQGAQEIIDRFKIYFEAGVKSCWLVEPIARAIVAFSSYEQAETFTTGEIQEKTLGITISLSDIFD